MKKSKRSQERSNINKNKEISKANASKQSAKRVAKEDELTQEL